MKTKLTLVKIHREMSRFGLFILGGLLLAFHAGCTASQEMRSANRLPMHSEVQRSPKGALAVVYQGYGLKVVGELIAVDSKRVYVLSPYTGSTGATQAYQLDRIKRSEIEKLHIIYAKNNTKQLRNMATVAYASLFSHLVWSFLTVPANILFVNGILETDLGEYRLEVPLDEAARFARFPQGLPEGETWETFRDQL